MPRPVREGGQSGGPTPEPLSGRHPRAGLPAPESALIDVAALERAYYERQPDASRPLELVRFGTSGHRGTPGNGTFTETHILAITQAICDYRRTHGIAGPLYLGRDTHALSAAAQTTALGVLAANRVHAVVQRDDGFTPTPVISHAILRWNRQQTRSLADGIVITPSHNPPEDGGFKYNPPNGGPAGADVTRWIEERANALLRARLSGVGRLPADAVPSGVAREEDLVAVYVEDLQHVIDMDAIRSADVRIGVDPLGGAAVECWCALAARYGLNLTVVNATIDPTFGFMPLDHDGRIRMDCSSPDAMAGLVALRSRFDVGCGTDPDADRHGIVTASTGLMNPNHFLAVAVRYLLANRAQWPAEVGVGKTVVTSRMVDLVTRAARRPLVEMPVGFKWFAAPLFEGSLCFGGEESAGASFLRLDGSVWTTDKDGIVMGLLAAEVTARTGADPSQHYRALEEAFGAPFYMRVDAPASPAQKARLAALAADAMPATELAGEPIVAKLTRAPANDQPIGGLKVVTEHSWFAARPSGTEDVYKIYAESFLSGAHLREVVSEARRLVTATLEA